MTDPLFAKPSDETPKQFGQVHNGRYHMPPLPGEHAPNGYVPRGLMRMTNLVGAFEDQRALNVWEQAMGLIGLAMAPDLYEELHLMLAKEELKGTDFERLRDYPELKQALAGSTFDSGDSIIGRAKDRAGANAAARRGTNRHTAWEVRGQSGDLIGTPAIQAQIREAERLLEEAGLERVPGLQERVVRNTEINAVGRFDDILLERSTGRLLIADLKTKATPFFSWMTVDAQLAGYAYADWMLRDAPPMRGEGIPEGFLDEHYEEGPKAYVDLTEGVILHVPSDGSPASLERADLVHGWQVCRVAAQVLELRSYARSAGRRSRSAWVPKNLASTS